MMKVAVDVAVDVVAPREQHSRTVLSLGVSRMASWYYAAVGAGSAVRSGAVVVDGSVAAGVDTMRTYHHLAVNQRRLFSIVHRASEDAYSSRCWVV